MSGHQARVAFHNTSRAASLVQKSPYAVRLSPGEETSDARDTSGMVAWAWFQADEQAEGKKHTKSASTDLEYFQPRS